MKHLTKILGGSVILNFVLLAYCLYQIHAHTTALTEVGQILGKSGIIESGENDTVVINRIIRYVDVKGGDLYPPPN